MSDSARKTIEKLQRSKCEQWHAEFVPIDWDLRIAIGNDFFTGRQPINGLRLPSSGNMNGWYLFAGEEMSQASDYFEPYCAEHLLKKPIAGLEFLALPIGWRFLVAPSYEDAWYDPQLISLDDRECE